MAAELQVFGTDQPRAVGELAAVPSHQSFGTGHGSTDTTEKASSRVREPWTGVDMGGNDTCDVHGVAYFFEEGVYGVSSGSYH